MSRLFVAANLDVLKNATTPITGYPVTLAAWVRSNNASLKQWLLGIYDGAGSSCFGLRLATTNDVVEAYVDNGTTNAQAITSTTLSVNTWGHACAVFTSATSHAAYLNGAGKGTDATNLTPTSLDRIAIGARNNVTDTQFMSGDIAFPAMWNVAFTDAEVAAAASGIDPCRMRPDALVGCWPIWGLHSPEIDLTSGGRLMTVTGTTVSNGPPIQPFSRRFRRGFTDQAAGAPPPSGGHRALLLGVGR